MKRDVADVRRVDRLDAALLERLFDGTRDEPVHDLVEDLVAKPPLDDRRGHLSRTESGHLGLFVALRDAIDLGIDYGALDLDRDSLLGFADVGEFGLHGLRANG